MAKVFYTDNDVDTTSKDLLQGDLLVKVTKQIIDSDIFEDLFSIFDKNLLVTGSQIEEIEVGNLSSSDFDATGANSLTKASMDFKALYHKINRRKTFKATVSDAQVKNAMLSTENMAMVATAITNELYNGSNTEDFNAIKTLLLDIANENKNMVICDLNGNSGDMDAVAKAIQAVSTRMTIPSTYYNFSGFKKAFSKKSDLVLIIDADTQAQINVDSLATAFNMDKKALVDNIIVIDEMPSITYTNLTVDAGKTINIGETGNITTYKYKSSGAATVSGSAKFFLVDRRAILRDKVDRELTTMYNGAGRFTNYYLHATDILSYSTLKNAIVFVD